MGLCLILINLSAIVFTKYAEVGAACVFDGTDSCKLICGPNTLLDLNPLSQLSTVKKPYTYYVNLCKLVTAPEECTKHSPIHACQVETGTTNSFGLGNSPTVTGDPADKNLVLNFQGVERSSEVKLICADEESKLTFETQTHEPPLVYSFNLHTRYACKEVPGSNGSGGLSAGSVLVILFFVFLLIYLVGGILFLKFVRRAEGTEVVPNVEFWKDFPLLVRDGVRFTCRGCKAETSYEKI